MEIPDRLLNRAMVELSPSEFKLLVWIYKSTAKKPHRKRMTTLDEFKNGVMRRSDGERVSPGCGLAKTTILRALAGLEEKKFITVTVNSKDKARIKKTYMINM